MKLNISLGKNIPVPRPFSCMHLVVPTGGFFSIAELCYSSIWPGQLVRGCLYKLKQKSVWHVPPIKLRGMLQAVLIQI